MTPPHLSTLAALARIATGASIPAQKYAALQRCGYVRIRGHGPGSKPIITDSGLEALERGDRA